MIFVRRSEFQESSTPTFFGLFFEYNSKEYFLRHLSLRRRLARPCFIKPHGLIQRWPRLGAGVATRRRRKGEQPDQRLMERRLMMDPDVDTGTGGGVSVGGGVG
jgi:hypothetical protein